MFENFLEKKSGQWTNKLTEKLRQKVQKKGKDKKTREEIGNGNQITALRFQTEDTSDTPASLWGSLQGNLKINLFNQ